MIRIPMTFSAAGPGRTESVTVREIRWVGASSAGDRCEIHDPQGNLLWDSVAAGDNYVEADHEPRDWRTGFVITTLESGALRIYVEQGKME